LKPVWHIPLLSVRWINSWWWTDELSETCRVPCQNKFVKLVHLLGLIIKKLVTMHGHMNVTKIHHEQWSAFCWSFTYILWKSEYYLFISIIYYSVFVILLKIRSGLSFHLILQAAFRKWHYSNTENVSVLCMCYRNVSLLNFLPGVDFISSATRPHQIDSPSDFLTNGYRELFPERYPKVAEEWIWTVTYLVPKLRMCGVILRHTTSGCCTKLTGPYICLTI